MKIREIIEHDVIQGSDEWKAVRIGKITGSNFKDVMPTAKPKKQWTDGQLTYLRKVAAEILTGYSSEKDFTNYSMYWGKEQEAAAMEYISDILMAPIRECGFFEYSEFVGSSPDGIIGDMSRTLEIKCPDSQTHLKYFLDPAELWKDYGWQVSGEMLCTGIDSSIIVSYDPRMPLNRRTAIYEPTAEDFRQVKRLEDRLIDCVELIKGWIE